MLRVYCPKCGEYVASYSEKCTTVMEVKCKKCRKLVIYHLGEVKIGENPQRLVSSGTRFY